MLGEEEEKPRGRRSSIISEIPERQHKRRPSVAKPFIPPLPLKSLPPFEESKTLQVNEDILSAYREESHRYEIARFTTSSSTPFSWIVSQITNYNNLHV